MKKSTGAPVRLPLIVLIVLAALAACSEKSEGKSSSSPASAVRTERLDVEALKTWLYRMGQLPPDELETVMQARREKGLFTPTPQQTMRAIRRLEKNPDLSHEEAFGREEPR